MATVAAGTHVQERSWVGSLVGSEFTRAKGLPVSLLQQLEKPDTFFYLWPHWAKWCCQPWLEGT